MKIEVCAYDTMWPVLFTEAEAELRRWIEDWEVVIEHIGSTAVPGLCAKPIIDILIGAKDASSVERIADQLAGAPNYHYISFWNRVMPFRRFLIRTKPQTVPEEVPAEIADVDPAELIPHQNRLLHLHIVPISHPFFERHVLFRDALLASEQLRDQYAALKRGLAEGDWDSGADYSAAKTTFIQGVLEMSQRDRE